MEPSWLSLSGDLWPGARTAFVLHGILGSAKNWRGFGKALNAALPGWQLVAVDHRNHGDSPPCSAPHTLGAGVDDLVELMEAEDLWPEVIVGHSYGGKVALEAARRKLPGLRQVWVLDALPGALPDEPDGELLSVMRAIEAVPVPLARRDEVRDHLRAAGLSDAIGRWMTTNLERQGGVYRWRFNLQAAREMVLDYLHTDLWAPLETLDPAAPRVELVRAMDSARWTDADARRLLAMGPRTAGRLWELEGAGHWLHVDRPEELIEMMVEGWVG